MSMLKLCCMNFLDCFHYTLIVDGLNDFFYLLSVLSFLRCLLDQEYSMNCVSVQFYRNYAVSQFLTCSSKTNQNIDTQQKSSMFSITGFKLLFFFDILE